MSQYLIVESRNAWERGDVAQFFAFLCELSSLGHEVTVYLVQNGVMPVRRGAKDAALASLVQDGRVRVLADDFSLRERGIEVASLRDGVSQASIDVAIDLLARGAKAIWH